MTILKEECDPDQDELYHYLAEKIPTKETQPLQWWAMNEHRFPKLSHLAKNYSTRQIKVYVAFYETTVQRNDSMS